jgi:S-DNA-T family DNA segregation ATPase FtsK/SpoIIIE
VTSQSEERTVPSSADRPNARPSERIGGRRGDGDPVIRLEIYGILLVAFALAGLAALVTFDPADVMGTGAPRTRGVHNAIGPVGAHLANLCLRGTGLVSFGLVGILGALGLSYVIGRRSPLTLWDVLGWLGVLLGGTVMLHVGLLPVRPFGHMPGGLLGEYAGEVTRAFFSTPGTVLAATTLLVVSLMAITRRSIFEIAHWIAAALVAAGRGCRWLGRRVSRLFAPSAPRPRRVEVEIVEEGEVVETPEPAAEAQPVPPPVVIVSNAEAVGLEAIDEDQEAAPVVLPEAEPEPEPEAEKAPEAPLEPGLKIVESAAMRRYPGLLVGEQGALEVGDELEPRAYEHPSLAFLDYQPPERVGIEREALKQNARLLEAKLADFKVEGKVVEIHPGPVVTMYELKPAPGIKISRIASLSDDMAMALSAQALRIVAPIPGKDVVGFELPNATRETVWLKEILADPATTQARSLVTLALGKDIVGNARVMDLSKAPHLLVAGSTGSGKSVAINAFICSILYRATPDQVRLIMVDPKMLELSLYEGIPHLLLPVVTDPKEAAKALRWAVKEMLRRYKLMKDVGTRDLAGYNAKLDDLRGRPPEELPEALRLARVRRLARGEEELEGELCGTDGKPLARMPQIVVIVDELADLMMVASKEVEESIARLAQMARAAGIHLILATQRPSTDVITGTIKSNLPTRISFRVASAIDSRTILDQQGAEKLLGMGDMLFRPPGSSVVERVHGCFVSEHELHRMVEHLRAQGAPDYQMTILADEDEEANEEGEEVEIGGSDECYDRAIRVVAESRKASISFIQRKLQIGYNRSARYFERMEREGIVGPVDHKGRREVLIEPP